MRKRFTSLRGLRNCIPILFMMMGIQLLAQISVSGTVTSKNGQPIPGVNVLIESTNSGTTTDFDGNYTLEVPSESTVLNFSYVGFVPQAVTVGNQTSINVVLEEKLESLEQIVVIGYGSRRKSDLTGSVTSVAAEEINAYPAVSAAQTLQGRAAGVNVQSSNGGEPGADIRIRVRGNTSINSNSEALFVVDGFVGGSLPPPEDIESIQILKDASSTAIYGSRGANGVVIVTTKKGKKGKMQIDFNTSYSSQTALNRLDLMNGDQFRNYISVANPAFVPLGANTDWQDEIYKIGEISNYQLSVSGGGENGKYYLSGTFFDQKGIVIESDLERFSFTSNVSIDFSDFVTVGMNAFARRNTTNGIRTQELSGGTADAGVIGSAFRFSPDSPIREPNGDFTTNTINDGIDNPIATARGLENENINDVFQANLFADFTLLKGLNFKTTFGYRTINGRQGRYFPSTTLAGQADNGRAQVDIIKRTRFLSENYFTYKNDFDFATLETTAGYSYQKDLREDYRFGATDFLSDTNLGFRNLNAGSTAAFPRSDFRESEIASYFARVNFDILDKYLFTFAGRYDGASTFARNNKWGFFPSGAFAWNMGREAFLEDSSVISEWKWRFSYGITGNPSTSPYETLAELTSIYSVQGNEVVNAVALDRLPNPNLKWEETEQFNIGLDLGFFNNRIQLTADVYRMITSDLLFQRPISQFVGIADPEILTNFGKVQNQGIEIELSTRNIASENFSWNTDINVSRNENEVLELFGDNQINYRNGPGHILGDITNILREGEPIGAFFGFVYDGIYQVQDEINGSILPGSNFEQAAGGERFRDIGGGDDGSELGGPDGVLNNDDRTVIGDPNPDFVFGIDNTINFKGFDFNVFFQGSVGGDMLNFTALETNTGNGLANGTTDIINAWRPDNPNTSIPAHNGDRVYRVSSRWVEDGSYVRLKNLTFGYSLDKQVLNQLRLTKLRVYVSGQNLLTFTNYSGLDPEVLYRTSNTTDSNVNAGLDYASYPNVRAYTLGLNVSF